MFCTETTKSTSHVVAVPCPVSSGRHASIQTSALSNPALPGDHDRRQPPAVEARQQGVQQRRRRRVHRQRRQPVADDEAGIGGTLLQQRPVLRIEPAAEIRALQVGDPVRRLRADDDAGCRRQVADHQVGVERQVHGVAGAGVVALEFQQPLRRQPVSRPPERDPRVGQLAQRLPRIPPVHRTPAYASSRAASLPGPSRGRIRPRSSAICMRWSHASNSGAGRNPA
jgi:hypothetical protein